MATRSARHAGAISGIPLRRRSLRSGGDIAILRHARDGALPSLAVLLEHDDAKREHAYDEADNASRWAATRYGFPTISMKNDWGQVFTFQGWSESGARVHGGDRRRSRPRGGRT